MPGRQSADRTSHRLAFSAARAAATHARRAAVAARSLGTDLDPLRHAPTAQVSTALASILNNLGAASNYLERAAASDPGGDMFGPARASVVHAAAVTSAALHDPSWDAIHRVRESVPTAADDLAAIVSDIDPRPPVPE